jgi:uncharacterized protein
MEPATLAVLVLASLATSVLSAIVGMAGGIVLLSVMLLFYEPLVVIPLHGVIQLVSNGSRTWIQRGHVEWWIVVRYSLLLLPTGFVGIAVLRSLPPEAARAVIGVFVLLATWTPQTLLIGTHPERLAAGRRFVLLGGVVGLLNTTIGATGPLIAPFFLNLGLDRRELVGTKAACQSVGHLVKLVIFGSSGFAFGPWLAPLALLCVATVMGTWLGSQILGRVSERLFTALYRIVLTVVALRLVIWDGAAALSRF